MAVFRPARTRATAKGPGRLGGILTGLNEMATIAR